MCVIELWSIATSREEAGRRKKNKEPPDVQKDSPVISRRGSCLSFAAMNWEEKTYRTEPDNNDNDDDDADDDDDDDDYHDDDRLH